VENLKHSIFVVINEEIVSIGTHYIPFTLNKPGFLLFQEPPSWCTLPRLPGKTGVGGITNGIKCL
jgi:hypothetical protein